MLSAGDKEIHNSYYKEKDRLQMDRSDIRDIIQKSL